MLQLLNIKEKSELYVLIKFFNKNFNELQLLNIDLILMVLFIFKDEISIDIKLVQLLNIYSIVLLIDDPLKLYKINEFNEVQLLNI